MSVTAEHIRALMALGIDGEKLLAVVQIIDDASRHVTRDASRSSRDASQESSRTSRDAKSLSAERSRAYRIRKRVARHAEPSRSSRDAEKPPLILTSLSSSEETLKKERKKESSGIRARAQLVPIPDDWKPSEHAFEVAEKYGSSVSDTEPIFRDYLKSSGKRYADYDAAFYNFLRNQRKFNGQNNGQSNGKPKSAIIQAADDLIRKIASFDGPARDRDEIRSGEGQNPPRLLSYGRG
jgi:hypothetical protein